ncbi:hypothetical protein OH76DRAFT_720880 [Lentinus brumalis]|uniref:DUF6534 domain-containing protein n=1 Tax=Lentinus brumalis TaxID=2498619 RepID=A0A371D4Y3_9APHY|nr:hypothetical protein OH76DRAFT_720880 [Polyporus brumalis]
MDSSLGVAGANGTAAAPSVAELSSIFSQTEGPILVASFISCLLYGLLLHQAYRYLRLYSSDLLFIRVLIPVVILVETIYTVCSVHYCYHTFVSNYARPDAFLHNVWSGNLLPIVGITAASVTHIFFIRRVWMIGGPYRLLSVLAGAFHIAGTGFGIAVTVRGFVLNSPAAFTMKVWILGTCFALNVSADMSISGGLLCVIYQGRSYRTRNMSIADKVAAYFVNTGILVLVLDMATLILAVTPHSNVNYGALQLINARMYAITLLSVLNSRPPESGKDLRVMNGGPLHSIARAGRLATIQQWNIPQELETGPTHITINVQTERGDDLSSQDSTKHLEIFEE